MNKLVTCLFVGINLVLCEEFSFYAKGQISNSENWLHEEIPCKGDHIRFDNTLPVVAFMDHNVDVESITLPNNGLLVFSDSGVDFGGISNWQCDKSVSEKPRDVFFTRGRHDYSFFNPENWIRKSNPLLHMNLVPSENDDVIIPHVSSVQIYLDRPVTVNSIYWYYREMTTQDFNVLLRSMEGQFQINLARPWARESDQGGVQRMMADDPIIVKNRKLEKNRGGTVNPNAQNQTLKAICAYIQCQGVEQQCIDSFVPYGHCCPVCGTRIELVAYEMDFDKANEKLEKLVNSMDTDSVVFVTFERKTVDIHNSKYEIALITSSNSSFDEDFHKLATKQIISDLKTSLKTIGHSSILNFKIFSSKIDRTVQTVSKILAFLIYFTILTALIGLYIYRNIELSVSRRNLFTPVIKYKRQNDDVAIEMDDVADEGEEEKENVQERTSEPIVEAMKNQKLEYVEKDVTDSLNINPNFEESDPTEFVEEIELTETPFRSPEFHILAPEENYQPEPEESKNMIEIDENSSDFALVPQEREEPVAHPEHTESDSIREDEEQDTNLDVEDFSNINPNFEENLEQENTASNSQEASEVTQNLLSEGSKDELKLIDL